jgi:hypothetical protein
LEKFEKHGAITTSITPGGKCFDFPTYAPDSLAFLLFALRHCGDKKLLKDFRPFLVRCEAEFFNKYTLEGTHIGEQHFSGMRDHAVRKQSCYDSCMLVLIAREAQLLGFESEAFQYYMDAEQLKEKYWNGRFFNDEYGIKRLSGDASIVPFWLGFYQEDHTMGRSVISLFREHGMTTPFPLAYSPSYDDCPRMIWQELFVPGWERDAKWMQLGLMYAHVAKWCDKEAFEEARAALFARVEKDQNFLEVFTPDGRPYTSLFYHADEGMLWGAALARKIL